MSSPDGLMVASDVAARGLDIHHVQHVIHYQVPHSTEVKALAFSHAFLYVCSSVSPLLDLCAQEWADGTDESRRAKCDSHRTGRYTCLPKDLQDIKQR